MDIILQNVWLQIALALLPALIVTIILLLTRKMAKISYLLLTGSVVAAFAFTTVNGTMQIIAAASEDAEEDSPASIVLPKREDLEDAVYAFLSAEDTVNAARLVTAYADAYGYDETCSLMTARIAVYEGRYAAALGIYQKLYGGDLPNEAVAVEKIILYNRADNVLADRLSAVGVSQNATVSKQEIEVLTAGGAKAVIAQIISSEKLGTSLKEGAEWVAKANKLYDDYASSGAKDEAVLAELTDELSGLSARKTLNKLDIFREARLKIALLNGDFEEVVDDLDEYTSCTEYMIALDLYLNGKVEKRPLTRAFDIKEADGVSELIRQLKVVRDENEDDLDNEELLRLEQQIDQLESYESDVLLYYLEGKLAEEAEDQRNYQSASKIYLSLAKLADENGNDVSRNQYFSDALLTSPDSDDAEYSEAMDHLANAITGDSGSESIKNVPQYADQAIKNSYILQGVGEIVRNPEKEEEQVDAIQDYTVKASAAVTINGIDTTKFNEIVVKVQLSDEFLSEHELINLVRLNDCNYDITDYTIEKVDYEKANIILCCDNSGSMSGSVDSLQNAVSKFIASSNEKETIGFYTFDDSMIQSHPLGSIEADQLQSAIDSMGAYGGTNIFGSLEQILNSVTIDSDANQAIILMTDGQDNYNHSVDEINSVIGSMAVRKGYIIYVLGMGSNVDTDYLSAIAAASGGQFIYSPSDSELDSLYTFIHGALQNQYKITFKAKDTLTTVDRRLTVELDGKNVSDTRYYSLSEEELDTAILPFDNDVAVFGMHPRLIYKQKDITDVDIKGKGFQRDDSISISLIGDRTYRFSATYIDENTFRISLPSYIPAGSYDMEVFLNNRQAYFPKELTVADGEADAVIFGGYTFTAFTITEYDDHIDLSGYVTMNDWLHFSGDITLRGSVDDVEMTLVDYSGAYIDFTDAASAAGYAKFLKEKGVPLYLPALGELVIYNAVASDEDYPTTPQTVPLMQLFNLCNYYYPILRLYPDRITLEINDGDTKLPFQDLLLSETSSSSDSPFSFDFDCKGTISSQNIDIAAKIEANVPDGDETMLVKFLDTKASIQKTVAAIEFDTMTNKFGFEFAIKIPGLVIDTYVGLGMQWRNMTLDGVQLHCDRDITKTIGGIPVTFSDFMFGVTDMATKVPDATSQDVSGWTLTGGMAIDACKVSAVVPKLEDYVGDVSLLSIPDAKFELRLNNFLLKASASLEMLNCVEIAHAEVQLGNIEYENELLGLGNTEVDGVSVLLASEFKWDKHNLKIELSGEGEATINSRFTGVSYDGTASMELNWWIFEKTAYADGKATVGFYKDHSNNVQFTIRTSQTENGKRKGAIFYISSNGDMNFDLNHKY